MASNQKVVDVKVPLYQSNPITIWSTSLQRSVSVILEQSVMDVVENFECLDYGVGSDVFKDDEVGVRVLMKKCGYYPLMDKSGKQQTFAGTFLFQHYTRKVKDGT